MTYPDAGVYRLLLPAMEVPETAAFADFVLAPLKTREDLLETALIFTENQGDIIASSAQLHCHQNTVRYRLNKIREITGLQNASDAELYLQLRLALLIDKAKTPANP